MVARALHCSETTEDVELLRAEESPAEDATAGSRGHAAVTRVPSRRVAAVAVLATALLAAAALVWPVGSPTHMAGGSAEEVSLVGVTPTNIRWLAHPDKCLDVAGTKAGAQLQIWDCDPDYPQQQGFLVPPDGTTGRIKWAQRTDLCLDSPGGHAVQFWHCDDAPAENLLWTVSPDGKGRIHWAAHPEQCLDIPDAKTENGWKLQVWYCKDTEKAGKDSNLRFISHPVDCQWSPWNEWGPCSRPCGGGSHMRTRSVATPAMNGGKDCDVDNSQSEPCNVDACPHHHHTDHEDSTPAPETGVATLLPVKDLSEEERRRRNGAASFSAPLGALLVSLGAAAATLA